MMKNFEENKKSTKRNHIKHKQSRYLHDDETLAKKAHKQFKQKKRTLEEDDDEWKDWQDNLK